MATSCPTRHWLSSLWQNLQQELVGKGTHVDHDDRSDCPFDSRRNTGLHRFGNIKTPTAYRKFLLRLKYDCSHIFSIFQVLGTIVVLLAWLQIILGIVNHYIYRARARQNNVPAQKPWHNHLHIWTGRFIFLLALITIPFGIAIKRGAPSWLFTAYGVWVALLVAFFVSLPLYGVYYKGRIQGAAKTAGATSETISVSEFETKKLGNGL